MQVRIAGCISIKFPGSSCTSLAESWGLRGWSELGRAHHDPNSPKPDKDGQEKPGEEQGAEGAESVPAAPEQLCTVPQLWNCCFRTEENASGLCCVYFKTRNASGPEVT